MNPTELHLYDFDGTLFRSPVPPAGWGDKKLWFADIRTLSDPMVPTFPPAAWWITSTVQSAKRSIRDRDVYTVLATGRDEFTFRDRLDEMIQAKGLRFDEVHLKQRGRTLEYKSKLIEDVLDAYPEIERVEIWEDREPHMAHLRTFVQGLGRTVRIHPVKYAPMPPRAMIPSPSRVAKMYGKL